mgnify:CR=1 FL=1
MKTLSFDNFVIELDDNGGGSITSHDLKETCPSCDSVGCNLSCDGSLGADDNAESDEERVARLVLNGAIDAIESLILTHACAGVNVEDEKYQKGIAYALDAVGNNS